jgi:hypothetical protein
MEIYEASPAAGARLAACGRCNGTALPSSMSSNPTQDMTMIYRTALAAALSVFALGAFAQTSAPTATPKIDARQTLQSSRIQNGVASGALTAPEAGALQAQQNRVARVENRAQADGVVGVHERRHISRIQDRASHHIRRQAHDGQHTPVTPAG